MLQQIRLNFDELISASSDPKKLQELKDKYGSPWTPSYEISLDAVQVDLLNCFRTLDPSKVQLLQDTIRLLEQTLSERGYRKDIHTHQEHVLVGSSGSGTTDKATNFPYTPCGILTGKLSIEEANFARGLESIMYGVLGSYFGLKEDSDFVAVTLEPLDVRGATIRDPRMVNEKLEVSVNRRLTADAPYVRGF